MPLNKTPALASTRPLSTRHATTWLPSANATDVSRRHWHKSSPFTYHHNVAHQRSRAYATVSDSSSHGLPPHRWPGARNPTPYDIFQQPAHAPYSKARFYELVKIYHPDRQLAHPEASNALPPEVRLERYRLVVAAHELLSDPGKRRAYDLYGAGWGQRHHFQSAAEARAADREWRQRPDSPCMNATWEDWEAWYQRQNGKEEGQQQSPLLMSNELFVAVLCVTVLCGSFIQARRANNHSSNLIETRDQRHDAISQDMRRRNGDLAMLDRHERVETFLRQREGWRLAESPNSDRHPPSSPSSASPPTSTSRTQS